MGQVTSSFNPKVLIAEDDPIVALDLQGMVIRLGYDVVAVVDNEEAIFIALNRFLPDIVLLGMTLSEQGDSIAVAKKIQCLTDIPIIFCVSNIDLGLLSKVKEIVFSSYLLKPINPDSLATALDTALYKYTLEKRVQKAEEKFKNIALKCNLMRYFLDHELAFRWQTDENLDSISIEKSLFLSTETIRYLQETIKMFCKKTYFTEKEENRSFIKHISMDKGKVSKENISFTIIGVGIFDTLGFEGIIFPIYLS